MPEFKKIELSFNYSANLNFRWQMFFNRFSVETLPSGRMISFASAYEGQAAEIVPIMVSKEGLVQLRGTVEQYFSGFSGIEEAGAESEKLPTGARRFSALFSNHIRLSHSGDNAEIVFYTMMLASLADEVNGRRKPKGGDMPLVPVAIFHSSVPVHYRLLCKLLEDVKKDD